MKILLKIFLLLILIQNVNAQWAQVQLNYTGNWISKPSFVTSEVGFILAGNYPDPWINLKLYITTNKGLTWNVKWEPGVTSSSLAPNIYFLNNLTGFVVLQTTGYLPHSIYIYKTTSGGENWNWSYNTIAQTNAQNGALFIQYINDQTGYVATGGGYSNKVYKTVSSIANWNVIFEPPYGAYITDLVAYNDIVYVGCAVSATNSPKLYRSDDYGNNFYEVVDVSGDRVGIINKLSFISSNNTLYCAGYKGIGYVDNNNPTQLQWHSIPYYANGKNQYEYHDILFTNSVTGYIYAKHNDRKIGRTTNSGQGYNQFADDYNLSDIGDENGGGMVNIGDIIYMTGTDYGIPANRILIRKININGQFAFDLIPNPNYSGAFGVDDLINNGVLFIPGTLEVFGGTLRTEVENKILENGSKLFYRWNTSMNIGYPYIDRTESYITANYKTKLKSTVPNAISPVSQTKAIKDTNGVINLIYESMGGIFYTRSTDGGNTFSMEEIVNYHPTEFSGTDNYNPCLAEIKPFFVNHQPVYGATNMAAVWERREGSTIKVRFSERCDPAPPNPAPPNNWLKPVDLFTVDNVPGGFECKPRLFMVKEYNNYDSLVAVLYLKQVNGVNQLWLYGRNRQPSLTYNSCIINGSSINSFSAAAIMKNVGGNSLSIHICYVQDGHIKYRHGFLEADYQAGVNWNLADPPEDFTISNNNILTNRGEPDITLRDAGNGGVNFNIQPVITYRGQIPVQIIIQNQQTGLPEIINTNYYPIVVRERLASGNWAGGNIQYNSSTIQQSPNIEGSKNRNSYILNFKRGSSTFIQNVVKWEGFFGTNYRCNPCSFNGVDAKFVRGGLFNQYPQTQNLHKLVSSSSIYETGVRSFDINTNPCLREDPGTEVAGIVINENMAYSFNLGSIMVNSEMIGFGTELDTSIESGDELNENLKSKPFLLNDNDTLVIGRNAFYLDEGGGQFTEVQYAVYLTNNSSGEKFLELARDTVHVGDSINVEYLEGFVIQNIPGGSDSFYVQMQIDTVWLDTGDDFSLNNIVTLPGGEGDASSVKKMVFWKNAKPVPNNIPTVFNLYQNFPNPFNPTTKIKYDLPKNVNVTIKVYDIIGREVVTLVSNEFKKAGSYEVNWNASNYASGVYIYRIQGGDYVSTKKMVLIK
jgi:photosystem II stability/assembly factor-like uncharacterized protein